MSTVEKGVPERGVSIVKNGKEGRYNCPLFVTFTKIFLDKKNEPDKH